MKIGKYLNVLEREVKKRKFNICIPISLGNKSFTRTLITEEILWALDNTREQVAILIGDKLQAINYEVRSGYSVDRAQKVAIRKGEEMKNIVMSIIGELSSKNQEVIHVLKWSDIESKKYHSMVDILVKEFKTNEKFKSVVLAVVREANQVDNFTNEEIEKL